MNKALVSQGPAVQLDTTPKSTVLPALALRLDGRARTTEIGQSHWFANGTVEQRRRFVAAIKDAQETAQNNRRLVLRYPDLAVELLRLGYSNPGQWSGYIPPRFHECGDFHPRWRPNDSYARPLLLDLVARAMERE